MFAGLKHRLQGKLPGGKRRSKDWPEVRASHLKGHPTCAVCGNKKKTEVHHVRPFHIAPELELEPTNLITLCELKKKGINCHLLVGHLGNYSRENAECRVDAETWNRKLKSEDRSKVDDLPEGAVHR